MFPFVPIKPVMSGYAMVTYDQTDLFMRQTFSRIRLIEIKSQVVLYLSEYLPLAWATNGLLPLDPTFQVSKFWRSLSSRYCRESCCLAPVG